MMQQLAVCICGFFIAWLFVRDRKLRPMSSRALWIPLLWIMIIGSRPMSAWFGQGFQIEEVQDYLDGSPFDRNVFLFLILCGLVLLLRRRLSWGRILSSNSWFFVFFFYCGISLVWSDYPFVGFKRWIKDIGNVIMVLIILTENDPVQALRAVFARYTYVAIPLSIVFIKYFPDIGRYYNSWTWESAYCGVTLEKNALGAVAFICGIFLLWDLNQLGMAGSRKRSATDVLSRLALLAMVAWLIRLASSSTSLVCLLLGGGVLLLMRYPFARRQVRYLGSYSLLLGVLLLVMYAVPGILESLTALLGRNMTLTGRTDLWADLLKMPINPVVGTGYQSFWLGPGAESMWEKYYTHPNQAHNGFLEMYLNGGLVGVILIIALIISTGNKLKKELQLGSSFGILRFSFFVPVLFFNWTEASFTGLNLVWILLIIAALTYSHAHHPIPARRTDSKYEVIA